MPTWVLEWLPVAPWLALLLAVLWILAKHGKPGYGFLRKVVHFFDDLIGEEARPGVEARPGLLVRMEKMESSLSEMSGKLDVVHHEMFPNSGSSLRDQTNRIEAKVTKLDKKATKDYREINDLKTDMERVKGKLNQIQTDTSTATGILKTITTQGEES